MPTYATPWIAEVTNVNVLTVPIMRILRGVIAAATQVSRAPGAQVAVHDRALVLFQNTVWRDFLQRRVIYHSRINSRIVKAAPQRVRRKSAQQTYLLTNFSPTVFEL